MEPKVEIKAAMKILRDLVLTPSSGRDDKNDIIEIVLRNLEARGFECDIVGDKQTPAMLATRGSSGVMFSGHLDTVLIGDGWKYDQGEIDGSILYGRGTSDMKGGCAAILLAADILAKANLPMTIAFTTDEESGMRGAEHLARSDVLERIPAVIVCEPTSLRIGAREKGPLQMKITTTGKSCHAAMPHEGDNAVHRMLDILHKLGPMTELPKDPMESVTMNVGVIRGGSKVNVVPDYCEAEIDVRTPADVTPEQLLEQIKKHISSSIFKLETINMLAPILTPMDSPIVKAIKSVAPNIGTIDIAYATEMVKFGVKNRNIVSLGPGDPRQAHIADEHIDVTEVAKAAELYCAISGTMAKMNRG